MSQNKRLGTPVVPFCPFYFGVSLLKRNSRKKGTRIIHGLLGNLEVEQLWLLKPISLVAWISLETLEY